MRRVRLRFLPLKLSLTFAVLFSWFAFVFSRDLQIHFVNVGHGDCTLIQTPCGKNVLIDAGLWIMSFKLKRYLRACGVTDLDLLIVTHPDPDHYGGAKSVVKAFPVKEFASPGLPASSGSYRSLLRLAREKGIRHTTARRGFTFRFGEVTLKVLSPPERLLRKVRALPNANSLVVRLSYRSFSALFAADIEAETEEFLLQAGTPLRADILKVPHHGVSTSCTEAFLDAVRPRYAIITCAYYAEPSRALYDRFESRGITWFRSDANGTVVFRVPQEDPRRIGASPQRGHANSRLKVAPDWFKLLTQTKNVAQKGKTLWKEEIEPELKKTGQKLQGALDRLSASLTRRLAKLLR